MYHESGFGTLEDKKEQRARNIFWGVYIAGVVAAVALILAWIG